MVYFLNKVIRQKVLHKRRTLPNSVVERHSKQVCNRIKKAEQFRQAKHIGLYYSTGGEICLDEFWKSIALQGKYCYFPVLNGEELLFLPATPTTPFRKNRYNIMEPEAALERRIEPSALDIVYMPLVAFDGFGNRLGMGKGYYDKTFAQFSPPGSRQVRLVGVAHEFQKQALLSSQPWDVALDEVVTEKEHYLLNLKR